MTARDVKFISGYTIPMETILPVKDEGEYMVFVTSGPYEGLRINKNDICPFPLYQELLQRREEVAELMREREQLRRELAEVREAKKVMLPREVAEAVENLRNCDFSDYGIIIESHVISSIMKWPLGIAKSLKTIRKFTYQNTGEDAVGDSGADLLLKALVNGYTIEEPQTFQTNRKLDHSEIRAIRRWYEGALLREKDGTDPDGFAKEAIEEVALYLGGAELLKDISGFCKTQLEREQAAQSG